MQRPYLSAIAVSVALAIACGAFAQDKAAPQPPATGPTTKPVVAKPLSDNVKKGLAWLAKTQQKDGGWAQGEESAAMGTGMEAVKDISNVADTSMVILAFLRTGSTPAQGDYAANILAGLDFVCKQVEQSDPKGLPVTSLQGTRLQKKLGTYIDTFMAGLVLAEVRNQMPDDASRKRVVAALDKVMDKIEKNQKPDGTWANEGWAPVIAQNFASKAINSTVINGGTVDEKVRERAEDFARAQFDQQSGKFRAGNDSAGVELYNAGNAVSSMQYSGVANLAIADQVKAQLASPTAPATRAVLEAKLARIDQNAKDLQVAAGAIINKVQDQAFMSGFGSNGGEEFLSYMNIGEALVINGGADWEKWDKAMTDNLNRIQNADGTWTGHHCVTGRTFCTAASVMVLTVDRVAKPLAEKIKKQP